MAALPRHSALWTFQWLRWCSREQYHAVPHAVHFLVTDSAEQDGNEQRRVVIAIGEASNYFNQLLQLPKLV